MKFSVKDFFSKYDHIHKLVNLQKALHLFPEGDFYHIETSLVIWRANQWTGSYKIGTSVMKELIKKFLIENLLFCAAKTNLDFGYFQ